jgi:hypothetical protein
MASRLFARVITHVEAIRAATLENAQPTPGSEPFSGSHAYANARMLLSS